MTRTTLIAALAAGFASLALPAQAQNFLGTNLTAMNDAFNARLNAAMSANQNRIVSRNMADPRVMAAWRSGACGQGLSAQQVAYVYAATGGCTPQGRAYWAQNEAQNRGNEQMALQRYRAAQGNFAGAIAQRNANFAANTYRRGMMLGGWNYNYLPNGGYYWYR